MPLEECVLKIGKITIELEEGRARETSLAIIRSYLNTEIGAESFSRKEDVIISTPINQSHMIYLLSVCPQ